MPRAIWSGAISFGLVNIPVKLYSAVSRKTVRFHQIDAESGQRIRQQRVNPENGEEVPYEQIVKGYEISPEQYVTISPEELEALEPQKTRTIDIEEFVDLEQIDPIHYDHPYYLAPDSIEELAADGEVKTTKRELDMAKQLIESLSGDFKASEYKDEYREAVLDLIERKAAGETITVEAPEPERKEVPDLMAALEASIASAKSPPKKRTARTSNGSGTKKKKAAAKK